MARQSRQAALPPFLLTRPAAQGDRFADQLRVRFGADLVIVTSPLIAPRFLDAPIPDRILSGVIFTSETGVAGFRRLSAQTPPIAWCVGDRTSAAARDAGFTPRSAGADAHALVRAIQAAGQRGPLLFVHGRETTGEVAESLNSAGTETFQCVVYAQEPQPLTPAAHALLAQPSPVICPIFSPRTGRLFAALASVQTRKSPLWLSAFSPNVAAATVHLRPERQITAAQPTQAAMLAAIEQLLHASSQP